MSHDDMVYRHCGICREDINPDNEATQRWRGTRLRTQDSFESSETCFDKPVYSNQFGNRVLSRPEIVEESRHHCL
jgi:hypothetical protein